MSQEQKNKIIISLGGSLIVQEEIDVDFISKFRDLVLGYIEDGKQFFIIVGGGKTCRKYQNAAKSLTTLSRDENDQLGIEVTKLNAFLIKTVFGGIAHSNVISDPSLAKNATEMVVIGAGWKPGCSTDLDAVKWAQEVKANIIINLSNIDYVYDSDPKGNPNAKPLFNLSWPEFREIIPKEWKAGLNSPFDPIASAEAEKLGLEVVIMNGKNLDNFKNYLTGNKFQGTIIK